jgi:predicted nucleic acid-binding protein
MIILDTNVIAALMREMPDDQVVPWLDRQPRSSIWTTAINVYETRFGLLRMPSGRRRDLLMALFERVLAETIQGRVANFDFAAAEQAADLEAVREKKGRPGDSRDTMIAGIVVANHATLATRNVRHFEDIAAPVVNPWDKG